MLRFGASLLMLASTTAAAPGDDLFTINANNPEAFQIYGQFLDAEGDLLLVGAEGVPLATIGTGPDDIPGFAELRDATTGSFISTLPTTGLGPANTVLVTDVHLSGDHAFVGLRNFQFGTPRRDVVEVFDISNPVSPVFLRTLQPSSQFDESFGFSIAVQGNIALIGAPGSQVGAPLAGSAYLYDLTTGQELSLLFPNDTPRFAQFGYAVGLSGNIAVVTSRGFSPNADQPEGSARFYDISDPANPVFLSKVSPPPGTGPDQYGDAVAIDGNLALVGAFFDDEAIFDGGSVYAYDITDPASPVLASQFQSPDPESSGRFGDSIDLVGNIALIGESVGRGFDRATGTAYIYDLSDLSQPTDLLEIFPQAGTSNASTFGRAAALSGDTAYIGAPQEDIPFNSSGQVFAFDVALEAPCLADVNMDGSLNGLDFGAWLGAFNAGLPSADQNQDGNVNGLDFGAWLANFNAGCD